MRTRWIKLGIAGLLGCVCGFMVPQLRATAETGRADAISADSDQPPSNQCKCEVLKCPSSDGMHHIAALCAVRCREGETPDCKCGGCNADGVERPNQCTCKH